MSQGEGENGDCENGTSSTASQTAVVQETSSDTTTSPQDNDNNADESSLSLSELLYSSASFHAIVKPVTLTMILSALAVVYINTEETRKQGEAQLSASYKAFDNTSSSSNSTTLGLSLVNALIIVSAICAMTFLIVLLYKYKCLKVLMAYMMLASIALLAVLGGTMFNVAIQKYNLGIDVLSFVWFMYNFALVGTFSIFLAYGVPRYMTQFYLIATSVILAWQLAHFDAWTSWTLLVMLALYDLCAVLTPCGPLKWLLKLMTKEDSPGIMPGLLYEAELPADATRPNRNNGGNQQNETNNGGEQQQQRLRRRRPRRSDTEATVEVSSVATTERSASGEDDAVGAGSALIRITTSSDSQDEKLNDNDDKKEEAPVKDEGDGAIPVSMNSSIAPPTPAVDEYGFPLPTPPSSAVEMTCLNDAANTEPGPESAPEPSNNDTNTAPVEQSPPAATNTNEPRPTAMIPLAIAKLYRLRLVQSVEPTGDVEEPITPQEIQDGNPNVVLARRYTPAQLRTQVEAIFPRNGGRIEVLAPRRQGDSCRYVVRDRHGIVRRRLVVNEEGRVMEERARSQNENAASNNTIKLGLGDFIFYSILVATAALYSFTTFAACTLVVLAGLGFTLVLLAVYGKALPALPISILLGVVFYLLSRYSIEPWIEDIFKTAYYV